MKVDVDLALSLIHYQKSCKQLYAKLISKIAKQYCLTPNECDVLIFLHNNPKLNTASDIVVNRLIAKSNVSTAIDSLKKANYLRTEILQSNRRIVRLYLTENSKEIVEKLAATQNEFLEILIKNISNEEIKAYILLLEKSQTNVKLALSELEKEG